LDSGRNAASYTSIHISLVYETKWEIDSLASFMGLSYRYWNTTGDNSFVQDDTWVNAVENILSTIKQEQDPTFNKTTGKDTVVLMRCYMYLTYFFFFFFFFFF
jgi:meiotically up-regulated gene 157 (Mug157) protein